MRLRNKEKTREYWIYLAILISVATIYYWFFEKSVISPQTGWWQYMAWRMQEGDLPYKDFFLYVPPYFVLLTRFLYSFFENNFIFYTIAGFVFTRLIMWILLYNILVKVIRPRSASIGMLVGICITSSYVADQCYDYNPLILMLTVLSAYIVQKIYCSNKKKIMYIGFFAEGILCGTFLMLKQNVGIIMPIVFVICIFLLQYFRKDSLKCLVRNIFLLFFGCIVGAMPGIFYLFKNGIIKECLECITRALSAKTSNSNFLLVALKNFFDINALIIALLILAIILIVQKRIDKSNFLSTILLSVATTLAIGDNFKNNILGFFSGVGSTTVIILLVGFVICLGLFLIGRQMLLKKSVHSEWIYYGVWCIFIIGMFMASKISVGRAEWLYFGIDFPGIKSKLLYVILYIVIAFWFYMVYEVIFLRKKTKYEEILFPSVVLLLFMGTSFVSARLEELYAVIIVPIFVGILLDKISKNNMVKNLLVYIGCFILSLVCLVGKLYIPYDWHGWTQENLLSQENPKTVIEVEELKGFQIAKSDAEAYRQIVSDIKKNSDEDDVLFQFPNILLFNVLTQRKTIYGAVPYFDVCPDDLAIESANYLKENLPELVLYSELNEGRWDIHELLFRNGEISGQRQIKEFYENTVKNNYRKLGVYTNRSGDPLCLWKKTAYIFRGEKENIDNDFEVVCEAEFLKEDFDTFSLYSEKDLIGKQVDISIIDLESDEIIYDNTVEISSKHMNYMEAPMGNVVVDVSHTYKILLDFKFDLETLEDLGGQIFYNDICFIFD